jgi:hypothetical protein
MVELFCFFANYCKDGFFTVQDYKLILISTKLDGYIKVHRGSWGHI